MIDSKSVEIRKYKDGHNINTSTYDDYKRVLTYLNNYIYLSKAGITSFVPLSKIGAGHYGFRKYATGDYFLKNSRPYIFFGSKKPKPKKHNHKEALDYLKEMPEHEGTIVKGGFFDGQDMRDVLNEIITSIIDLQSGKWDKSRMNSKTKSTIVVRSKGTMDIMKMLTDLLSHAPNFELRKKIHDLIQMLNKESVIRSKYLTQELENLGEL